jgi:tRNA(Arg) A34 adenosine deaminase TadA
LLILFSLRLGRVGIVKEMMKTIGTITILILVAMASQAPAPVASQVRKGLQPLSDDPAATDVDRRFIRRAYEIARNALSHGNEPFGALLVRDGKILAEFENAVQTTRDVTRHAETGLISDVSMRLNRTSFRGSTLYVSTEPCTMCCGAIRWAGIERVVFGVSESQVDRIFEAHFGDTATPNALRSKEVFRRIAPRTKLIGPIAEAEGLPTHAEFWPKFLSRDKKEGASDK